MFLLVCSEGPIKASKIQKLFNGLGFKGLMNNNKTAPFTTMDELCSHSASCFLSLCGFVFIAVTMPIVCVIALCFPNI